MSPGVMLHDVSKRYRVYRRRYSSLKEIVVHRSRGEWEDRWALRGVTLGVEKGKTLGLIGPNGSGKSTALKVMARILVPDRGSVAVHGRVASLIELGAGFQPEYTGRENLYLNASLLGLSRRQVERRFDDIVEFAELQDHIDDPVRTYSSGMYMRLGFSIAIHVDAETLLIDEILAVGDEAFQRRCMDWLEWFKSQGGTIVLVSHSLGSISQYCEEAAWIEDGSLREIGRSAKIVDHYLEHVRGREEEMRAVTDSRRAAGAPEVELGQPRILTEQGVPVDFIRSGDCMILELPYSVHRRIETPVFGVSIHSNEGHLIHRTTTAMQGLELPPLERDGVLRLRYSRVDLKGGGYRFGIAVFDTMQDRALPVYTVRHKLWVEESGYLEGLINLDHTWEPDPAHVPSVRRSA